MKISGFGENLRKAKLSGSLVLDRISVRFILKNVRDMCVKIEKIKSR